MRLIFTLSLIITLFFCRAESLSGQVQFWVDDFEDMGSPSSGTRTPSNEGGIGGPPFTAYFARTNNAGISLIFGSYSGFSGSKFWASEDNDAVFGIGNEEQEIVFTVDIAGKTDLSFQGLFAANNINAPFENQVLGFSHSDYMILEYRIDGGAYQTLFSFQGNNNISSGENNKSLAEDTNGDGIGNGTILTTTFQNFTKAIAGTGNTLNLRIRCYTNGGNEEMAFDNFRLFEAPSCIPPVITANPPNRTICVGGNTTFSMVATGATAYQWQVNSGSGFTNISNGGVYSGATTTTLTITGALAGMSGYQFRCVAINEEPTCFTNTNFGTLTISNMSTTGNQTNISCFGLSNGAAAVGVSGGIAPYTYSWSPSGGTGPTATGLSVGTYVVTIVDLIGCSTTRTFTLTQPPALNLMPASQTNLACNGGATGAASVNPATGGTAPYTYDWTPGTPTGDGTTSITGLTAGTWTCVVTDANGCTSSQSFTLTQPTAINFSLASQTNVSCNGGSNGSATVNEASGGAGSYTYNWTPGNPTGDGTTSVSGLAAGDYTCEVTDANGCMASVNVSITQPPVLNFSSTSQTNVSCNGGSNGTASVTVSGGVSGYTYDWSPGTPSGDGTPNVSGLTPGNWTCTVFDANGCSISTIFTITQPSAFSVTADQTVVTCNGGNDGSASVEVNGATAPYTYLWSPSGGTGAIATGLTAGNYMVEITDNNSCSTTVFFTIQENTDYTVTQSQSNVTCHGGNDGSAEVEVDGLTGPYTYLWSPSGGTGASETGLNAGDYSVTIEDSEGCAQTFLFTIGEPDAFDVLSSQMNQSCPNEIDGEAGVSVMGNTAPYTYLWSTGETSSQITNIVSGMYTLTVSDANMCDTIVSFDILLDDDVLLTFYEDADGDGFGNPDVSIMACGNAPMGFVDNNTDCDDSDPEIYLGAIDIDCIDNQIVDAFEGECSYIHEGTNWDATGGYSCTFEEIFYDLTGATTGTGSTLDGVTFAVGETTVTWTINVPDQGTEICSFIVTVEDNQMPIILCAETQMVDTDGGVCTYTHESTDWDATGGDNCGVLSIIYELTGATLGTGTSLDGVVFELGETEVTWTIEDESGIFNDCSFTVTVQDVEQPEITCLDNQLIDSEQGICQYIHMGESWNAMASDNCGIESITYELSGATTGTGVSLDQVEFNNGVTVVTWTAVDVNDNISTCSFEVSVGSSVGPEVECAGNAIFNAEVAVIFNADQLWWTEVVNSIEESLNNSFGISNWEQFNYITADATEIFSNNYKYVYLEGGFYSSIEFSTFLSAHRTLIESWVDQGGQLFLNAAPNQGGNIDLGFGGFTLLFDNPGTLSLTGIVQQPTHPIFTGPLTPSNGPFSGGYFAHAIISPAGMGAITLLSNQIEEDVLVEYAYGIGKVIFGGMTPPFFHTPLENSSNMVSNIHTYLSSSLSSTFEVDTDPGECTYTVPGGVLDPTATHPCGETMTFTHDYLSAPDLNTLDGAVFSLGMTLVTWTIEDESGNIVNCSIKVNVEDNESPLILCTETEIVDTDAGVCTYTHSGTGWDATGSDNCGIESITYELTGVTTGTGTTLDGVIFELGETEVTWTIEDENGNFNDCSFTVTVEDNEAPVIACINDEIVDTDLGVCTYTHAGTGWDATGVDNCGVLSITYEMTGATLGTGTSLDGVIFELGETEVIWTIEDENGNFNECNFTVTVEDNELPMILCAESQLIKTDEGVCTYTHEGNEWDATGDDNCAVLSITYALTGATTGTGASLDGVIFELGETIVTWTIEDENSNFNDCSFNVTVEDNEAPVIACVGNEIVDTDAGVCTYTHTGIAWDATGEDNCGVLSITYELAGATIGTGTSLDGVVFEIGETEITWTIEDESGNFNDCSFTVNVEDNEAPVIACVGNEIVDTDEGICTYTHAGNGWDATGEDNCGVLIITYELTGATTGTGTSLDGVIFELGETTVIWTIEDENGNFNECSFTVNVEDNELPIFPRPSDISLSTENGSTCPGEAMISIEIDRDNPIANNNEAFTFFVHGIEVAGPTVYTDNCSVGENLELYVWNLIVDWNGVGDACERQIRVTWRVMDEAGNFQNRQQIFTIVDDTAPVVEAPEDELYTCYSDVPLNVVLSAEDNCAGEITVTGVDVDNGGAGCMGDPLVITRTWTFDDGCGNITEVSQTITVIDDINPEIESEATDLTVECDGEGNVAQFNDWLTNRGGFEAMDNCSDLSYTTNPANPVLSNLCGATGAVTVTFIATDECGNSSESTATFEIEDTIAPDLSACPSTDLTIECNSSQNENNAISWNAANIQTLLSCASDVCSGSLTVNSDFDWAHYVPGCGEAGQITVNYEVVDECGNISETFTSILTIENTTPPVVTIEDELFVQGYNGTVIIEGNPNVEDWEYPTLTLDEISVNDNCGSVELSLEEYFVIEDDCEESGYLMEHFYTITAIDECGNTTVVTVTLRVVDTTAPVIYGVPEDVTVTCGSIEECPGGGVCEIFAPAEIFFDDNCDCGLFDYEEIIVNQTCAYNYDVVRRWTARDKCGNQTVEEQVISVRDVTAPFLRFDNPILADIENGSEITVNCESWGLPQWVIDIEAAAISAVDDCMGDVGVVYERLVENGFQCTSDGYFDKITYTWSAQDACGNVSEFSFAILLTDNNPPQISGPATTCDDNPELSGLEVLETCSAVVYWDYEDRKGVDAACGEEVTFRTWMAVDACNNYAEFEQVIYTDRPIPTLIIEEENLPPFSDNTVHLRIDCGDKETIERYRQLTVKAEPTCGGDPEIIYSEDTIESPDCSDGIARTIIMVWTAQNECGQTNRFVVEIELEDKSRPIFVNNASRIESECGEDIPMPSVGDGCSQAQLVLISQDTLSMLGACNNKMMLAQRFEARDICGNSAQFSRTVRIVDTKGPEFVHVSETICVGEEIETPEVIDGCGEGKILLSFEDVNNDCNLYSSRTRIWRAEDECGNVSYFEQTIMIGEQFGDFSLTNPFVGGMEEGGVYRVNCSSMPAEIGDGFTSSDVIGAGECSSLDVSVQIRLNGESNCAEDGYLYDFSIIYRISHVCLGVKEYSINVIIEDDEAPIFIYAPEDVEMYCEGENGLEEAVVEDDCGEYTLDYTVERFGSTEEIEEGNYRMRRRWVATDRCGNSSVHVQQIRFYHYEVEGRIELVNSPLCNSVRNFATAEVDFGTGPYKYDWTVLNGECEILGDRTAKTINYRIGFTPVTLQVRITDSFGCETTAEITFVCESIETRESSEATFVETREMVLYPNPTKGRFMLEWSNESEKEEVEIRIYGGRGELQEVRQTKQMRGLNKIEFDYRDIAPGVYHLELIEGDKVENKRFIVID